MSLLAAALVGLSVEPAVSYGGLARDPWNPAHLERLPLEIRADVQKWDAVCAGGVAAAQQFAPYVDIPGARLIALHFDDSRWGNKAAHCRAGEYLHQVYVATAGRYRRVLSLHASDIRLLRDDNTVLIEVTSGLTSEPRLLRWTGRRFVE
jgi:hypothetical protein